MHLNTAARGRIRMLVRSIVDRRMVTPLQRETFGWVFDGETVYDEGGVFNLRGEIHSYYPGLEEAISALRHELEIYGNARRGEKGKLLVIERQVDSLAEEFLDVDRLFEEEDFSSIVAGLADWLTGVRDQDKSTAKRDLTKAASTEDSLGRRNPWRQRLLLGQASLSLEKRLLTIDAIKRKDGERLLRAVRYYRTCATVARLVKETLGALIKSGNWRKITLFPNEVALKKTECLLTNIELDRSLILLKDLVHELEPLVVRPFLVFRNLTLGDLHTAIGALQAGKQFAARAALERAFSGSRIALAHVRLVRIRWDVRLTLLRGKDVDASRVEGRIARFRENLSRVNGSGLVVEALEEVKTVLDLAGKALRRKDHVLFDELVEGSIKLL